MYGIDWSFDAQAAGDYLRARGIDPYVPDEPNLGKLKNQICREYEAASVAGPRYWDADYDYGPRWRTRAKEPDSTNLWNAYKFLRDLWEKMAKWKLQDYER